MSLLHTLRTAVESWRRRLGGIRPRFSRRRAVTLERLDHRQLLSVTFTGNAKADIPDNSGPGFAIVTNSDPVVIPDPTLRNLIKVSGFQISAIRMKYTPNDDILSFAIEQPGNQKTIPEFPVIAGDADNNLNGGTVSPAVTAVQPLYRDFAFLGESETMFVFLDMNNDTIPDVVAGISNDPGASKLYQVAEAVVNPDPVIAANTAPGFGAPLQDNTGAAFLLNADPTAGAFEFQILNFSQLYLAETGQPLRADSLIGVGAFAGSPDDFADEPLIRAKPVTFGVVPPPNCPPLSPPILVNPHFHRHVNTTGGLVRVTIFGTSGFDVDNIVDTSVRFGGAPPVFHFKRRIDGDEFKDVTYVFRGNQLNFPPGVVEARISGLYNDPTTQSQVVFDSAKIIFVRNTPLSGNARGRVNTAHAKARGKVNTRDADVPNFIQARARARNVDLVIDQMATTEGAAPPSSGAPVVALPPGRRPDPTAPVVIRKTPSGPMALVRKQGPVRTLSRAMNRHVDPSVNVAGSLQYQVIGNQATPRGNGANLKWASAEEAKRQLDQLARDMALDSLAS